MNSQDRRPMPAHLRLFWIGLLGPAVAPIVMGVFSPPWFFAFLFVSGYYVIPYSMLIIAAFIWSSRRTERQLQLWLLMTPLLYVVAFAFFSLLLGVSGGVGEFVREFRPIAKGMIYVGKYPLPFLTVWVLAFLVVWSVLRRLRRQMTVASPAAN